MITHSHAHSTKTVKAQHPANWIPPAKIEYAYYFVVFYSLMSGFLGIEIPLVAAGITLGLSAYCFKQMGSRANEIYAPIKLLLTCLFSFILVQTIIHGTSPMHDMIRVFILWIAGIILVQSLCLREGFLLRCTVVLFLLGLVTVPTLAFREMGVERAAVSIKVGGNLTNANGLAAWFGFCAVFFAVFGLETKGTIARMVSWTLAAASLFVVGLTVSRSGLLGIALALTFAFRRFLRRGFMPIFLLIILVGLSYASGLFDQILSRYETRLTEDTGREHIWLAGLERFAESPLIGTGVSERMVEVEGQRKASHNSILFFAITSGLIPLALWVAFWVCASRRSLSGDRSPYAPYRMPFLLYALSVFVFGDITTAPWVLLSLSLGAGPSSYHNTGRSILHRRIRRPIIRWRSDFQTVVK